MVKGIPLILYVDFTPISRTLFNYQNYVLYITLHYLPFLRDYVFNKFISCGYFGMIGDCKQIALSIKKNFGSIFRIRMILGFRSVFYWKFLTKFLQIFNLFKEKNPFSDIATII